MRASCGDGTVDSGESCDDGNENSGDGCSDQCVTEAAPAPTPTNPYQVNPYQANQYQMNPYQQMPYQVPIMQQPTQYQLPLASLMAVSMHPPIGETGPAALAIIAAGAAGGWAAIRRKR